jgi:hypothetical protein
MIERLLACAAALLIPVTLRILPFRVTLAVCDAWPRIRRAPARPCALARRVDRWMARGRTWWRPTCLTRTLVLYTMLRQHGHSPRLHIGTAGPAHQFRAHAWISLGGHPLAEFDSSLTQYRSLVVHGG